MSDKPRIPLQEVHKAQAMARHHEGQKARSQGYDPAALKALASYGKPTVIGEGETALELLPQTLQVQLCLIEHATIFPHDASMTVADGVKKMTHLALIYHDPDMAFEILTDTTKTRAETQREFSQAAFKLSRYFSDSEAIDKLAAHISAQMQLTNEAAGDTEKKSQPLLQKKALGRGRR